MPAGDITVKANYRNVEEAPSFEIKVNGGTGAGTYKEGESVTVTANDPEEGKIFKGWKDESGNIVSTDKSYTFTVSGEVSLTAVTNPQAATVQATERATARAEKFLPLPTRAVCPRVRLWELQSAP